MIQRDKKLVRIYFALKSVVSSHRGVALLMTLWVVVLLGLVASEFAYTMRMELRITSNYKEEAEAYYLAMAGVNAALAEIMAVSKAVYKDSSGKVAFLGQRQGVIGMGEDAGAVLPPAPNRENISLGNGAFDYVIEDEDGKLDLNWLTEERNIGHFKKLLRESGITDMDTINTITDSALDWRDDEKGHRLNGAEDEWYMKNYQEQGFTEPYLCKDGPFDTVEELLMVRGMTPEILYGGRMPEKLAAKRSLWEKKRQGEEAPSYKGIYPYLTVYNTSGRINLYTCDDFIIKVLTATEDDYNRLIELRNSGALKRNIGGIFTSISQDFTIFATGYLSGGLPRRTIKAVVTNRLDRRNNKDAVKFRYWQDNAKEPKQGKGTDNVYKPDEFSHTTTGR